MMALHPASCLEPMPNEAIPRSMLHCIFGHAGPALLGQDIHANTSTGVMLSGWVNSLANSPLLNPVTQDDGRSGRSSGRGIDSDTTPSGSIHRYVPPSGWIDGQTTA